MVGCAEDLGHIAENSVHCQLVREGGGWGVRKVFPAMLAFLRWLLVAVMQSVVKRAWTSGWGAGNREGGAPGARFVGESEGFGGMPVRGMNLRDWRVVGMLGSGQGCSSEGRA
jgi:hypothetical protein